MVAGDFDLAMSGVTWRPARAAVGWMSRAVAAGGPCVVSAAGGPEPPSRVAVNRGGILERWTRERFGGGASEITAVDDNLSLPGRLERNEVDAFVTDSFEVEHFGRDGWRRRCEAPLDRKVFWVGPGRADDLGPAVDRWVQRNERWLEARREEWFGRGQRRDELDHLLDLTARRLAFMPVIAVWKAERGVPIEDQERERLVLAAAESTAVKFGLDPGPVREWFTLPDRLGEGGAAADRRRRADVGPGRSSSGPDPARRESGAGSARPGGGLGRTAGGGGSPAPGALADGAGDGSGEGGAGPAPRRYPSAAMMPRAICQVEERPPRSGVRLLPASSTAVTA